MKIKFEPEKMYLKCVISFYTKDENNKNKKIVQGSVYEDLGIEKNKRKLKRVDRKIKDEFVYLDKTNEIKKYFKIL